MSAIAFRTPLQPEENTFFGQQFRRLDKEDLGIVTGESLKPLFAASGLPASLLSQIWAIVDTGNKGFLNLSEFSAAMRMIAHLQQRPSLPVTAALYETPAGRLPLLGGGTTTAAAAPAVAPVSSVAAPGTVSPVASSPLRSTSSNLSAIPLMSHQDVSKFSQLYDRTAGNASSLPGDKAKEIFMKARLATNTLGDIWALCDRNVSGSLTKQEFVMAMYLIQLCMARHPSVTPLPSSLPAQLWNSVNSSTMGSSASGGVLGGGVTPLSANSTGRTLSRQNTLQRLSSGVFNNASTDWSLNFEKKRQFDAIFDNLDKSHTGSLGPQVLVNFFLSSRLSQETLASIWDLADIHNNAEFTKVEFAIAMFLIQKKNAGVELPDVIPDQLLHSPALGLFPNQQPPMGVPSRETKPSFSEQPQAPVQVPQHSNNGSLNDLLALNNSFTSPSPPQQPPLRQTSSFSRDSTGGSIPVNSYGHNSGGANRNFTPQMDMGHNVIREEAEENLTHQQYNQQPAVQKNVIPQSSQRGVNSMSNYASPNLPSANLAGGGTAGSTGAAGLRENNDLYADAEASAQLSYATTEVANMSNQVKSLTKQAGITSDKKTRAAQELKRVNATKASIEKKLSDLRASHDQNVKQVEQLEAQLSEANKETAALTQQLTVTEGNYHAIESKVSELSQSYQEAQQKNAELRAQISKLNTMSSTLQTQLAEKQRQVKQERSMVDVNTRQLELNDVTVANFEKEINGLGEKLQVYLNKRKELDDYQKTVEQQHSQLQSRYQQLETRNQDLSVRGQELEQRRKALREQEKAYQQQAAQLQNMFEELNKKKASYPAAVREVTASRTINYTSKSPQTEGLATNARGVKVGTHEDEVSKFVEATVANSKLGGNEDEERAESDVFDKDVPTVGSQTEADDESETRRARDRVENITDRFEGDLNEYGIPRTQSLTSSVANNAPQSVVEDVELPETFQENTPRATANRDSVIPGQWGGSVNGGNGIPEESIHSSSQYGDRENNLTQRITQERSESPTERDVEGRYKNIDEEFPPIQELNVNESDSSSDSEVYQDTSEDAAPRYTGVAGGQYSSQSKIPTPISSRENPASKATEPPLQGSQASLNPSERSSQGSHPTAPGSQAPYGSTGSVLQDKGSLPPMNNASSYPGGGSAPRLDNATNSSPFPDRSVSNPSLPAAGPPVGTVSTGSGYRDEFDDEFAGLEQADEEAPDSMDEAQMNNGSMEEFEKIEHQDLDDELQQNAFTDSQVTGGRQPVQSQNNSGVSNDEWDEIFAGFGNSKPYAIKNSADSPAVTGGAEDPVENPLPVRGPLEKTETPVKRSIATTPRSLAVEELSGMGFTDKEAVDALEKCKWDLEAATNYLLDSA